MRECKGGRSPFIYPCTLSSGMEIGKICLYCAVLCDRIFIKVIGGDVLSSRLNISVSDDLRAWLEGQSKLCGIPMSAVATMLLNEARRNRELQGMSDSILLFLNSLTPEQKNLFFSGKKKPEEFPAYDVLLDELKAELKKAPK